MEIVKAFSENTLHTEITIKGTHKEPLFRASDIGLILELSNIRQSIKDFDETQKVVILNDTHGGTQQVTFLTEEGLYEVLSMSRKPIAKIFKKWVFNVVKEIRLTGEYKLNKEVQELKNEIEVKNEVIVQKDNIIFELKEDFDNKVVREREKFLLKEYGSIGHIIYLIRVRSFEDGTYVIKVGKSEIGVDARYKECRTFFGENILLLDCFCVLYCKEFESKIHENFVSSKIQLKDLKDHENQKELILIGKDYTYKMVIDFINKCIGAYEHTREYFYFELQQSNQKIAELQTQLQQSHPVQPAQQTLPEHQEQLQQIMEKVQKMENAILEKSSPNPELQLQQPKPKTQQKLITHIGAPLPTLGPRLQQINPETLMLIKFYESVSECIIEWNNEIKRPSINKAIVGNTIYRGFRWALVDRDLNPSIIYNIEPTKEIQTQTIGYVAKVNQEKIKIVNVYLDKKTACSLNGNMTASALDNPIKNETLSHGFYYILFDKCEEDLKEEFMERYEIDEIILYKDGKGVGQYDVNNKLVKEFRCKFECIKYKPFIIGEKTLPKVLDKNVLYKELYYFKTMNSKLYL